MSYAPLPGLRTTEQRQQAAASAYLQGLHGWSAARADGYLAANASIDQILGERQDAAKRRCVKGTACGNACIATGKTCRTKGNPQKLARLTQLLALPAAGQTSGQGPGGARPKGPAEGAKKPSTAKSASAGESVADLKAAIFKAFSVKNEKELKQNRLFRLTHFNGNKAPNLKSKYVLLDIYRKHVAVPKSERNLLDGPRVIRGIDVTKNFRPWYIFDLDAKTATPAEIKKKFGKLALKHHPDHGGDPQTFDALRRMRDTLLVLAESK
jgi:hypothetical protein